MLLSIGALVLVLVLAYGVALASTGSSQLARAFVWLDADVGDIDRFPSRVIESSTASNLPTVLDGATAEAFQRLDPVLGGQGDLNTFLASTESTALLVIQNGVLVHEWYGEGIERETLQTSFSVSKSFLSTLIGIAIDEGSIGSITDPITDYVPELLERDERFGAITLQNLITMSSGFVYNEEETPWGDAASTYYSPDLRATALSAVINEAPGQTWLYNNYNPLLLGLALERATGQNVTDYMSKVLWAPLGAEANASWSLDSISSGFEKMESGLNARAVDFARFGLMAERGGLVDGKRIVSEKWLREATAVDTVSNPDPYFQYFWWVYAANEGALAGDAARAPQGGEPSATEGGQASVPEERAADFAAEGNFGQYIYVAPNEDIVIVRLGRSYSDIYWPGLLGALAHEIGPIDTVGATP